MSDQVPQSIEAEAEVLSSILDSVPAIRAVAAAGLQPEHFYLERHRAVFRAQRAVARGGHHADEIATWSAIESMGLTDQVDRHQLAMLAGASTAAFNVRAHTLRVIELANKRLKIEGAHKILEGAGVSEAERSAELIHQGMQLVSTDYSVEAEPTTRQELADDFFTFLDDEEPAEVWKLPWPFLNECVNGGLRRKQTTVWSGYSEVGKSLALDQALRFFHKQGARCAIFGTEMSRRERVARYLTGVTQIPTEKLLLKQLTNEEEAKVVRALPTIPFDYHEANGWHVDKIAERIVFGGFDVVAVDHVSRLPGFEKTELATAAVARLVETAVRGDLHLILVAQLNKTRMGKDGKAPRPLKQDLRQTSALENDAHQILFVHRQQDEKGAFLDAGEIFWGKVRNGPKASVKVGLAHRYLTFEPLEHEPQGEQTALDTGKETVHDREAIPA